MHSSVARMRARGSTNTGGREYLSRHVARASVNGIASVPSGEDEIGVASALESPRRRAAAVIAADRPAFYERLIICDG